MASQHAYDRTGNRLEAAYGKRRGVHGTILYRMVTKKCQRYEAGSHADAVLSSKAGVVHFKHGKPIGATGEAVELLRMAKLEGVRLADSAEVVESLGVVTVAGPESMQDRPKGVVGMDEKSGLGGFADHFLEALAQHRHWGRVHSEMVPA
ncbi:hypothetical protein BH23GEM6_BH23GEM6_24740 [soil metagenome]